MALHLRLLDRAGRARRPRGRAPRAAPGPGHRRAGRVAAGRALLDRRLLARAARLDQLPAAREYAATGAQLAAAARTHARPEREAALPARYRALQAAVPAGAPLVVLLDQPAYLDYARNRIINVDTPGYASYAPGLPYFRGSEPVAAYLRGHGLRHVAFVRGDHSRYFYRRELWLARIQFDAELWRVVGAYIVDLLDTFADLATRYPVLHDEDGLVVVDLGAGAGPGAQDAATAPGDAEPEPAARERFVHDLLVREGLGDTWAIMGRADVVFADGWSRVLPPDPELVPRWRGFAATVPSRSARAVRWLGVRGHVRVRADAPRPHRLRVWGAVDRVALFTRPRLTVTFDGRELDSRLVAADGAFMVEAVIPGEQLEGWSDVYLTLSSVSEPWREPERLRLARVEGVTWEPAP